MHQPVQRLTLQGRRAVVAWHRSEDGEIALEEAHSQVAGHAEWDQAALTRLEGDVVAAFEPGSSDMDAMLAPRLHEALPLGRHLASDRRVWGWFGAVPLRGVIEHRWPRRAGNVERYDGALTVHGLGRLWWAAELTLTDDAYPYAVTHLLVRNAYLLDRLLRSRVTRSRTVMLGVVDALHAITYWKHISETMKRLGAVAGTVCLDALTRPEVAELARELADEVRRDERQPMS